jgi:hypothetical protein
MQERPTVVDGSVAIPGHRPARPAGLESWFERLGPLGLRLRAYAPGELGAVPGRCALAVLLGGVLAVVVFTSSGPSILVPRSGAAFPAWEAGPVGLLFRHLALSAGTATLSYSGLILLMTGAYGIALLASRSLSLRTVGLFAVAVNLILLVGPQLQLNDVFNYLGYARLGGLHGLNPYTHVMNAETYDPVFRFATWHNLTSPYGPLFTALSYPLAWLPLPVAYWIVKLAVIGASLGFLWCVYRCAIQLGLDPRPAILFVAANPVYILFAVGGFHNDFFMLLPSTAAIALLLARRDRAAGAVLMVAVAIKFTAILRVISGVVLAAIPLIALSLALFGFTLPNLAQQSSVVTGFSIPNVIGLLLGFGGTTSGLVRILSLGVVVVVLIGLRRRDWVGAAGWSTLALVASVTWLMPWYIVWVLPLAALSRSPALRRSAIVFTVFLVLTFIPETGNLLNAHGFNALRSPADQAAYTLQTKLQR